MSYTITIFYHDEYGELQTHDQHVPDKYLVYDDLMAEPIAVRNLMKRGIVIGRMEEERMSRRGSYIPAARIVRVFWEDDYEL